MSLHQFAHGGDLHLGPNDRNVDRRRAFDQFVTEALDLPYLAAVLLPGDLNHGRMTIDDRNYLADRLTRLAHRAPVVLVRGNHDLPGDLDIFPKLATSYPIHLSTTPEVVAIRTATGAKASIFCLPYPTEAELVARGVAPGDLVQTARAALAAIFEHARVELAAARDRGDLTLAIGHVNVGGSRTGSGQPNIGQEIEIDEALIARLDCYVGLNHIHVGQDIGGACYPGSFCRLDWSEVDPKAWIQVDLDPDHFRPGIMRRPIDVAPMWHLEGEITRDGLTLTPVDWVERDGARVDVAVVPQTWEGCEVRARVRIAASERDLIANAKDQITQAVGPCVRLAIELITVPDRALRAPAVAAAKTLAEKVGAWADLNGAVVTPDILAMLAAIEHGDPFLLHGELQREIAGLTSTEKPAVAA